MPNDPEAAGAGGDFFRTNTKADIAADKRAAQDNPDNRNPSPAQRGADTRGYRSSGGSTTSSSRVFDTESGRLIGGLMFFAVGFSLAGHEIQSLGKGQAKQGGLNGPTIIIGGFAATAVLTLVSHAGEGGRQFAVGLALVTTVSSLLVYGGPVWKGLSNLYGSKPTTPTAESSATNPTNPTTGTATGKALAQVA